MIKIAWKFVSISLLSMAVGNANMIDFTKKPWINCYIPENLTEEIDYKELLSEDDLAKLLGYIETLSIENQKFAKQMLFEMLPRQGLADLRYQDLISVLDIIYKEPNLRADLEAINFIWDDLIFYYIDLFSRPQNRHGLHFERLTSKKFSKVSKKLESLLKRTNFYIYRGIASVSNQTYCNYSSPWGVSEKNEAGGLKGYYKMMMEERVLTSKLSFKISYGDYKGAPIVLFIDDYIPSFGDPTKMFTKVAIFDLKTMEWNFRKLPIADKRGVKQIFDTPSQLDRPHSVARVTDNIIRKNQTIAKEQFKQHFSPLLDNIEIPERYNEE
jgi:hypothetical protein